MPVAAETAEDEEDTLASMLFGRAKVVAWAAVEGRTVSSTLSDLPKGALEARLARGWRRQMG